MTSCTPHKKTSQGQSTDADLLATRPISDQQYLWMINLSTPALLNTAEKTTEGWKLNEKQKQDIFAAQGQVEAALKKIEPEAQVVFRYNLVLNALAIFAKGSTVDQLQAQIGDAKAVAAVTFSRPQLPPSALTNQEEVQTALLTPDELTSADFIGAPVARLKGLRGQGITVAVLDTGIDYTHKMLGGPGRSELFKQLDGSLPNIYFPNSKVVGGADLVGSDFSPGAVDVRQRVPRPDPNPIDEVGHGTHVAGTVAGRGDGINTYDGVAPDAKILGYKIFGKDGGTADSAVIRALELALDPNEDGDISDRAQVINLSLGGGLGQPADLYNLAIGNVSRVGTMVVASAGNSGPTDYIVGAPSTVNAALSVAATYDAMKKNWQFSAVRFSTSNGAQWLQKLSEGPISKPIAESDGVSGELVDFGLADTDPSPEIAARLKGQVALIQRGKVPFLEKLKRAEAAGAIGAVVYNNQPGDSILMSGEGKVSIPATMISQVAGLKALEAMKTGAVRIDFKISEKIEQPELIDSMAPFSSKGPRSEDNILKPEIAGPGMNVLSAKMGSGDKGIEMSGTSMSAPHLAGAMALLRQARPSLSTEELKSLAMNTAKVKASVPMTLQGAGRIDLSAALSAPIVSPTPAISLGQIPWAKATRLKRQLTLRNISEAAASFMVKVESSKGLNIQTDDRIEIAAGGERTLDLVMDVSAGPGDEVFTELEARVQFWQGKTQVFQVPILGVRTLASQIQVNGGNLSGGNFIASNSGQVPGLAMLFNLLAEDKRKALPPASELWKARNCDLESVGYRILTDDPKKSSEEILEVAFKITSTVTTWHICSFSVLFDHDGDGEVDQELGGVSGSGLPGVEESYFNSALLNSHTARQVRSEYESKKMSGQKDIKLDYKPALIEKQPMIAIPHSTVAVLRASLKNIGRNRAGLLRFKAVAQAETDGTYIADDYVGDDSGSNVGSWLTISPDANQQTVKNMKKIDEIAPGGTLIKFERGQGSYKPVLYYPVNDQSTAETQQQQIIN